jgi:N-glycosylase/DNA lyase
MIWTQKHEEQYSQWDDAIQQRLAEFSAVPATEYFYELCYCLCTPQSKALHAEAVVALLRKKNFLRQPFDPTDILAAPQHYIRFHRVKAQRLLAAHQQFPHIQSILTDATLSDADIRMWLVENISGLSHKEAAHFLRNIGYRSMVILDRHILKHLVLHGLYQEIPSIATTKQYYAVAERFCALAKYAGHSVDELDLFFWASETGFILK